MSMAEMDAMKALADDIIEQGFAFIDRQREYQELNGKEDATC